ncbi:disease resistance protein PIK6-NP-like [Triticum aestivum]|uniref:disease resistance protein PIK6-NP-like n=1 Tax=Triticum aestivum TaxID=4565 RepID=UPI001D02BA53|nr:disease resistance protein PIK6-NP-like [Triticum aestivum]
MEAATQLASIVGELVGKEYRQLRGVGGKVAELSDELDTMNAILRMLSDAEEGTVDHFIRVWMKQVRELAYDAEDCVHLYILRIRCRPKDRFLVWSKRMLSTLFPRRRLAREIEALRARAVVISERQARYGVSREALLRGSTSSLPAPAPVPGHALGRLAANGHDQLVGITDKANKLAEKVEEVSENEHDKKLKVFSIVGFGGLGKTTLAMEVCRKLEGSFQRQALVSVSQAFHGNKDLEGLLKRMLQQIVELKPDNAKGIKEEDPLDGINEMGVDLLTIKLNELLRNIRSHVNKSQHSFSPIPPTPPRKRITTAVVHFITASKPESTPVPATENFLPHTAPPRVAALVAEADLFLHSSPTLLYRVAAGLVAKVQTFLTSACSGGDTAGAAAGGSRTSTYLDPSRAFLCAMADGFLFSSLRYDRRVPVFFPGFPLLTADDVTMEDAAKDEPAPPSSLAPHSPVHCSVTIGKAWAHYMDTVREEQFWELATCRVIAPDADVAEQAKMLESYHSSREIHLTRWHYCQHQPELEDAYKEFDEATDERWMTVSDFSVRGRTVEQIDGQPWTCQQHGIILTPSCLKCADLMSGRYLIVVDDVWTVAAWDTIGSKLPDYNNGSRIIVTTRIEIVANACSGSSVDGDCIYRIKPLDTGDSKTLFLSRVLRSRSDTLPNNLKAEMNKILEKCGGLPMAIISIASILGSYTSSESKDTWERVRKSIGSQMESHPTLEGMKQIVTLSYNHLHYYLKGCMMYVSIFPEDYVIVKNRLLRRWVAEGLVAEIRGLTLMEVAEAYYNELVSRSMIDRAGDIVNHYDGRLETCRVHDMVLEVMVSKSLEANFVSLVGGSYEGMSYGSIRRLSIHAGEEVVSMESTSNKITSSHAMKNGIEGMKMEHVRSLSMFDLRDHMKVLDRLGEFSLLRVLDLEDCMGIENKHLRHVCRMYLLRFLSMKGTSIDEMPPEVGDLENLETLDVRETNLEDLPETVSKLEKLEHLQINNKADKYLGCWIARRGLGRMKALRMVNTVVFGSDAKAAKELGELQQMRELRITMDTRDPDDPHHEDVREKLAKSLSKMYSLRWLSIGSKGYKDSDALNFLDGINPPPPLLEYLRIGASIDELPTWVSSLNNLVEIVIAWTYLFGAQLFGPVCELPNLKRMHLERYSCRDAELIAETAYAFPALKDLYVNFLYEDIEVLLFQEASMAKLETLSVRFPTDVFKEVAGMEHLRSLKEVQLIGRKGNSSLGYALDQLKKLNEKRQESNMIKVAVKYE